MDVKLKLGLLFNMPKSPPPVAVMSADVASACPVVPTKSNEFKRFPRRAKDNPTIPIIGCLRPTAILRCSIDAVDGSVGDSRLEKWARSTASIIAEDSKRSKYHTTVRYTVPVAIDSLPPAVCGRISGKRLEAAAQTVVDEGPHDLLLLLRRPDVVHPVISDGECGSEFCGVQEVLGVPLISCISPRRGAVSSGVLMNGEIQIA